MERMSLRCAKCGAEIPEGSPVCRSCFEPVKPEGFFRRLRSAFGGGSAPAGQSTSPPPARVNVKVREKFKIRDPKTGEVREYQSLDEVPAEYREKIRQARDGAMHGPGGQKISFTDAAGQTHTFNSLDEVPPDIRALIKKTCG